MNNRIITHEKTIDVNYRYYTQDKSMAQIAKEVGCSTHSVRVMVGGLCRVSAKAYEEFHGRPPDGGKIKNKNAITIEEDKVAPICARAILDRQSDKLVAAEFGVPEKSIQQYKDKVHKNANAFKEFNREAYYRWRVAMWPDEFQLESVK